MKKQLILMLAMLSSFGMHAQVILDDWKSTPTLIDYIPSNNYDTAIAGEGIVGGHRGIQLFANPEGSTNINISPYSDIGYFSLGGTTDYHLNRMILTYDGDKDSSPSTLDATNGLGGIDMTGAGTFSTAITGTDPIGSGSYVLKFRVYSSPTQYSEARYKIASQIINNPVWVSLPASVFTTGKGADAAADFSAVTAVQMILDINSRASGWNIVFQGGITVPSAIQAKIPSAMQWLSFSSTLQNGKSILDWQVVENENAATYTIERSSNGKHFSEIGSLDSKYITDQPIDYQFIDTVPLNNFNYYRIKLTEKSGVSSYSQTGFVNNNTTHPKHYVIYPSPATDMLTIEQKAAVDTAFYTETGLLLNMQGKIMMQFPMNTPKVQINLQSLASDTYILKLADGSSSMIQKI